MGDSSEEFDPLFDYSRGHPSNIDCLEDDSTDESPVFFPKKRKISEEEKKEKRVSNVHAATKHEQVINCDDEEDNEEDWLPLPPQDISKCSKIIEEDETLRALRLTKQELATIAQSAEDFERTVEESARKDLATSQQSSPVCATKEYVEPPNDRAKLIISFQDKDGVKQYRIFADDKFERLFKMYADKFKVDVKNLAFVFDGDKVSPTATPGSLGMEENDIIEVHVKSSSR